MPTLTDFDIKRLDGAPDLLAQTEGKVVLAVNVASECGLTPQYKNLQALYDELAEQGFLVVGFPCNQFGAQEPGDAAQIGAFCEKNYGVTFPLSEKIEVNGDVRHPLYAWLTGAAPSTEGKISWNFEKFLIGRDGNFVAHYPPTTEPQDPVVLQDIAAALA